MSHLINTFSENAGVESVRPTLDLEQVLQRKASLVVCDCAKDIADARDLLWVLGLVTR